MRSGGVPEGAKRPYQSSAVMPSMPACLSVGAPLNRPMLFSWLSARMRSLPAATMGSADAGEVISMSTVPPIRSVMAGAAPRYGTCTSFTPAFCDTSAPIRWLMVPFPGVA
ncbi:hypothetical protein D9M68_703960 [compost metagenome]